MKNSRWIWWRSSLEGYDGKASHQKLLIVYMSILFTFMLMAEGYGNVQFSDATYPIIGGVIVGQSAIRAWQTTRDHKIDKEKEKEIEVEEIRNETRRRKNTD